MTSPRTSPSSLWQSWWPTGVFVAGLASAVWPVLSVPAAFFSFLGVLSLPPKSRQSARLVRGLVGVAALGSCVGLVRFVVVDAMPGIVGGGRQAVERRVVSQLRTVLSAQDAMRRLGWIDPDADGIGSAALLSELCGGPPSRGQPAQPTPVLSCGAMVSTPLGPAARSGPYLYTICLPSLEGGWSAQPSQAVNEEKAERRFVAYAWPDPDAATGFEHVFFIDEHESILSAAWPGGMALHCDSALGGAGIGGWSAWRGKTPRPDLPGDTTSGR